MVPVEVSVVDFMLMVNMMISVMIVMRSAPNTQRCDTGSGNDTSNQHSLNPLFLESLVEFFLLKELGSVYRVLDKPTQYWEYGAGPRPITMATV
jgi:hypothetical protein